MGINDEIQKAKNRIVRRAWVKRRLSGTGQFESDWLEITKDVKNWGQIRSSNDDVRRSKYTFGNLSMKMANDDGDYNDENNDNSIFFGYASRQRSLVMIEVGFQNQTLGANGIWTTTEFPTNGSGTLASAFIGVLTGDMPTTDKNDVTFSVKPLIEVFRQYPARLVGGWTSTGITASRFMEMLRDHTDGSANFVFRPFFGDTTSNWDINTTTSVYSNLNTSTADDVIESNCWQIIEKLAEAEQFIPYSTSDGVFTFKSAVADTTTVNYEFHGIGSRDRTYGQTIKKINSFGKSHSRYYSRVQVKFAEEDTATSYETVESSLVVSGANSVWNLGHRTLKIENTWIPDTATANTIATTVFNEVSNFEDELKMSTTLVPQLEVLDKISVTYDSSGYRAESNWDERQWAGGFANEGKSIFFAGTDQYITIPHNTAHDVTSTATFSIWVKGDTQGSFKALAGHHRGGDAAWEVDTSNINPQGCRVILWNSSSIVTKNYSTSETLLDNTWHNITFVFDNNDLKIYVDFVEDTGVTKTTDNTLTSINVSTEPSHIGCRVETGGTISADFIFVGYLDEPALFTSALSDTEVAEIGDTYDLGEHSKASDLVMWYRMGDGDTYPTVTDQQGNSDGTLTNMTTTSIVVDSPFSTTVASSCTGLELIWDKSAGNNISLNDTEFKALSITHDLDKLETKVTSRST